MQFITRFMIYVQLDPSSGVFPRKKKTPRFSDIFSRVAQRRSVFSTWNIIFCCC